MLLGYLFHPIILGELSVLISYFLPLILLFCLKVRGYNFSQPRLKKFTLIVPIIIIASKCKDDVLPLYDESENDNTRQSVQPLSRRSRNDSLYAESLDQERQNSPMHEKTRLRKQVL